MTAITVLKANVSIDNTGRVLHLPAIYVEGHGVLTTHLRYLRVHKNKSISWMSSAVRAIRLLLRYMQANEGCFETPQKMFEEFSDALLIGTCDSSGKDSSDLRWKPRSDAKDLIRHVTAFSDWLCDDSGGETQLLNPMRKASQWEKKLNLAAYHHKVNRAFLSHTFDTHHASKAAESTRNVSSSMDGSHTAEIEPAISFDECDFLRLLEHGFRLNGVKSESPEHANYNLRDILITLLLHYGGLRESEPFHLYLDDISEDPERKGSALVKAHHPSDGIAPEHFRKEAKRRKATRKEYLNQNFGIEPRWKHPKKSYRSGWKKPLLDSKSGKYFVVQWFPAWAGEYFLRLWKLYIKCQYVRPARGREHPFAFTNQYGDPASLPKYLTAHSRAVKRIGLTPAKELGTTPHAHRHAYGQRLVDAGVHPLFIKRAMHHKSIESQLTYTEPSALKVQRELAFAESRLAVKHGNGRTAVATALAEAAIDDKTSTPDSLPLQNYESVDPLQLFSGRAHLNNHYSSRG